MNQASQESSTALTISNRVAAICHAVVRQAVIRRTVFSAPYRSLLYRKRIVSHVLSAGAVIFFTIALSGLTCLPGSSACVAQEWDREVVRFVGEVAVGTEYSRTDQVVKKWLESPKLSVFNANEQQSRSVSQAVELINDVLSSTEMSISIIEPNDEEATLKVIFAPVEQFPVEAAKHEFQVVPENDAGFYIWWNGKYEIERAVVLLSSDQMKNKQLQHFALEEISQSLGFAGDSGRFPKSVFYENQADLEFGDATRFSSLDKKLMRFIYDRVEPGTPPVELGLIMSQHWADAK